MATTAVTVPWRQGCLCRLAAFRPRRPRPPRAEIDHFFSVYKMLEPGKHSETRGYDSHFSAWEEIKAARARHLRPDLGR